MEGITEENKQEIEVVEESKEEKEKEDGFNFWAFLLTGIYYIYRGKYPLGIFFLIITILVPLNYYFIIGLCCGFFTSVVKYKATVLSIVLSSVSVLVFIVLKTARLYFLGGM